MDRVTPAVRSRIMSGIRSVSAMERRAGPLARRRAGCPLRHQPKGIPGNPDYANKRRKVVVFVHGCFWHGCGKHYRKPKSNAGFWRNKIAANMWRDSRNVRRLRRLGWRVVKIWEHEVRQ